MRGVLSPAEEAACAETLGARFNITLDGSRRLLEAYQAMKRERDEARAALREAIAAEVERCSGGEQCARHDRWRRALGEEK
jgi:hypothetical protein